MIIKLLRADSHWELPAPGPMLTLSVNIHCLILFSQQFHVMGLISCMWQIRWLKTFSSSVSNSVFCRQQISAVAVNFLTERLLLLQLLLWTFLFLKFSPMIPGLWKAEKSNEKSGKHVWGLDALTAAAGRGVAQSQGGDGAPTPQMGVLGKQRAQACDCLHPGIIGEPLTAHQGST